MRHLPGRVPTAVVATVAATVVAVVAVAVAGAAAPAAAVGPDALAFALQIDRLVELIERVDRLLEAILDLVQTVRRLFGVGGD